MLHELVKGYENDTNRISTLSALGVLKKLVRVVIVT